MKISIKATNMELTDTVSSYTIQKIETLSKMTARFEEASQEVLCEIELEKVLDQHSGDIFRAEVNIQIPGESLIRAEQTESDLYAAIDGVRETLFRTVRSQKNKKDTLWRKGAAKIKSMLKRKPRSQ